MNNYNTLKLIGKGSYGTVFKIEKKSNNKIYALKQMSISKLKDKYEINNLLNELKILCFHDCKYLLKCKEIFYENNKINIVTDFAKFSDLSKYIEKYKNNNKKISEKTIWLIFIQCCYGIDYLHDYNIIHRDLKPANILLNDNSSILIADFGISKILENKINSHTMIGTPYYISPEMYKDKNYDKKIDIWALGCILYELATLTVPFNANNLKILKYKIINSNYYHENLNYYSKELKTMIKYLLDKSVCNRLSIKEIISTKIFKKMEHKLQMSNNNQFSNTISGKLHSVYETPIYSSIWNKVINEIEQGNNNKTLNKINIPEYPVLKHIKEVKKNIKETKYEKDAKDKKYKKEKKDINKIIKNQKKNIKNDINMLPDVQLNNVNNYYSNNHLNPYSKLYNKPKKEANYEYNNHYYDNEYYKNYYNGNYNKFNYQSRYNSEYKDKYKKNYNIISNSRLPPINYGQYYL